MDFWQTVAVLLRRWYIAVPAFLLSLGLAGVAYSATPLTFRSDAVLVLTTPVAGGTEFARKDEVARSVTNPMMNFDRGLSLSAAIVIEQMNTSATARLDRSFGPDTTFRVSNGSSNPELLESGPFVFIEATGPSPEAAQKLTAELSRVAGTVLDERQTELQAPESTHINLQFVVPPTAGTPLASIRMRAAAAAGALAGLIGLASAYCVENATTRRRREPAHEEDSAASIDSPDTALSTSMR